ncbi:hypothetical protein pb186bvf_010940 [Paramecium bursaria]
MRASQSLSDYKSQADSFYQQQKYEEAIRFYNMCIKLDPKDASFYFAKGDIYYACGNTLAFFNSYEAAIQYKPDIKQYRTKADSFYQQQKYEEAIRFYGMCIKLDPKDASFYFAKGDIYYACGNTLAFFNSYEAAIQYKPDIKQYRTKADSFYQQQKYEEAIRFYNICIKLDPKDTSFYFDKGDIYYACGNTLAFFNSYEAAIQYKPDIKQYRTKADSFYQQQKYEEAIRLYNMCNRLQKNSIDIKFIKDLERLKQSKISNQFQANDQLNSQNVSVTNPTDGGMDQGTDKGIEQLMDQNLNQDKDQNIDQNMGQGMCQDMGQNLHNIDLKEQEICMNQDMGQGLNQQDKIEKNKSQQQSNEEQFVMPKIFQQVVWITFN